MSVYVDTCVDIGRIVIGEKVTFFVAFVGR